MPKWKRLGSGSYNTAYKSNDGREVLKIQHDTADDLDTPSRSVRLWNELNPQLPPPAYISQTEYGIGWVCPFVEGRQASDTEMSAAVINIFNLSGRIVVDATAKKNFVTTSNGQVVCVDIGMALQMEAREEELFASRRSITSLNAWSRLHSDYIPFFDQSSKNYPETVSTVKALLFITSNRPDIFDVSFLRNNLPLVQKLAIAYDRQDTNDAKLIYVKHEQKINESKEIARPKEVVAALNLLEAQREITFVNIRESSVKQLEKYISSRGSINSQGEFTPSLVTKIFRNTLLTAHKVEEAKKLIGLIKSANTLGEIRSAIQQSENNIEIFTHGMGRCIGKCVLIIDTAEKAHPDLKLANSDLSLKSD